MISFCSGITLPMGVAETGTFLYIGEKFYG